MCTKYQAKMNQLTGTGKRKQNHVGPTGSELPTGPGDVRSLQMKRSFFPKFNESEDYVHQDIMSCKKVFKSIHISLNM